MEQAGRVYRGATAASRAADRRERLIRAAIAVYGEVGYRDATVAAVCRAAGLTPRYFYEAYANSEALLSDAFDAVTTVVIEEVEAVRRATPGPPERRMRTMLAAYYERLRAEPAAARVFLIEIGGVAPAIDRRFRLAMERFAAMIRATVAEEPTAAIDPLVAAGAMGGLLSVARAWIDGGYTVPVNRVVAAALPLCTLLGRT